MYVERQIKSIQRTFRQLKWDHIHDTLVISRGVNRDLKNNVTAHDPKLCLLNLRPHSVGRSIRC